MTRAAGGTGTGRMRISFFLMVVVVGFLGGFGLAFALLRWDRVRQIKTPTSLPSTKLMSSVEIIPNSSAVARVNSSNVVRIGLCKDGHVDEEARAVTKALATLFREGGKEVELVLTTHGTVLAGEAAVDIVMCLGFYYSEALCKPRADQYQSAQQLPARFQNRSVNNVFYPTGMKKLIHEKGRPFLIAFSGEPWDRGDCRYDLLFVTRGDFQFTGCALAYFPLLATTYPKRKQTDHHLVVDDLDVDNEITPNLTKREFMILVIKNCYKVGYTGLDALLRSAFFDFVSANYKKVHSLGGDCRQTPGLEPLPDFLHQGPKHDAVTERYERYKFVIAFENQQHPAYVTEKILNAVLARSVPVYWGLEELDQMLNPARFIQCHIPATVFQGSDLAQRWEKAGRRNTESGPFIRELAKLLEANFTTCLEEIKRLDHDDEAYLEMLRQPILLNNQVEGSIFDKRIQAKQIFEALRMQQSYLVADMPTP